MDAQSQPNSPFSTIQPSPSPQSLPSPRGLDTGQGSGVFKEPPEPTRMLGNSSQVVDENKFEDGFQKFVPVSSLIYRDNICRAFEEMAVAQDKRNVELARRRGSAGSRSSRTGTPSPVSTRSSLSDTGMPQKQGGTKTLLPTPEPANLHNLNSILGLLPISTPNGGAHTPSYQGQGRQDNSLPPDPGHPPGPDPFSGGFPQQNTRPPDQLGRMNYPQQSVGGQPFGQVALGQGFGQVPQSMGQQPPPTLPQELHTSHMQPYMPPSAGGMQYPVSQADCMGGRSQSMHAMSVDPRMARQQVPLRSSSMSDMGSNSPLSALANTVQNLTSPHALQAPGQGAESYPQGPLPLVEPNVYPAPLQPHVQPSNQNLQESLSVGTSPPMGVGTSSTHSGGLMSAPSTGTSNIPIPGNNSHRVTGELALPRTTEGLIFTERRDETKDEQPYDPGTELFPMETESRFSNSDHSDNDSSDQEMMEDIIKGKKPWQDSDEDEEDDDEDDDMDDDLINTIVKNQPLAAKAARSGRAVKAESVAKGTKSPGKNSQTGNTPRKKTLKEILQMTEEAAKSRKSRSVSSDDQSNQPYEFKAPAPKEIPTEITHVTEEEKMELEQTVTQSPNRVLEKSLTTAKPVDEPPNEAIPKVVPVQEVKDPPDKPPDDKPPEEKPSPIPTLVTSESPKKVVTPEKSPQKTKPTTTKKSATAYATRDPKLAKRGKRTFKPQPPIKGDLSPVAKVAKYVPHFVKTLKMLIP